MRKEDTVLDHLRIVELNGGIETSYAGRVLAELGARVTRVEAGGGPDPLRERGASTHGRDATPGALFDALNHGKQRDVVDRVDCASPEFRNHLQNCDVLLTGHATMTPGVLRELQALHPRLVIAVASQCDELDRGVEWTHLHAAAVSGVSALIGHPDRMPLPPPYELGSYTAGVNLAAAALAAVYGVSTGRVGQVVQVDTAHVLFSFMWTAIAISSLSSEPFTRNGRRFPGSGGAYPFALFPCADGYVACIGRSLGDWRALIDMMGTPAWATDARYQDPVEIARDRADETDSLILPWLRKHTRNELFQMARARNFPLAPVNRVSEVVHEPQFEARNSYGADVDVLGQPVRLLRQPYHFLASDSQSAGRPGVRDKENAAQLFAGLRVLDLSWVWSGPMVGAALADLGADVIKLENPARLDNARLRGRPMRNGVPVEGPVVELGPTFHQNNRGKRSLFLDFKDPAGAAVFRQLVRESDVVIENLTPGVFDRAGVGYLDLRDENPGLIWLAASAVGASGPLVGLRAYAPIMSALAGIEDLVGYPDDSTVGMLGCGLGDANAGSHALFALLAALVARQRDGRGRLIDMSQIEASAAVLVEPLVEAQLRGTDPPGTITRHPDFAPHSHYLCAGDDSWVAIAATDDAMWHRLATVVGGPALANDSRYTHTADRLVRTQVIDSLVTQWTMSRTRDEVLAHLNENRVLAAPVLPVRDTEAIFKNHLNTVQHPITGDESLVGVPWMMSDTPPTIRRPAPLVGQHSDEILRDVIAMDADQRGEYLARFHAAGTSTAPDASTGRR